ncbi:GTP 3',8-cyclase MoaA [Leptolyngbya sp. PCC 6406]|uniref:GTP 3',8-cyclase MoaA n=1 Tax=Leptolyngbya sp. PCC 6406 TaxID=1173264 RepID=UPI0002AC6BC9|nr:GTP 3',8-cyclase MoaA [Leptolyngbya sp. PCC 6406]
MNPIDYLRISVIDRCNFRCQYCMPEGADLAYVLRQNWLTRQELNRLLREVFVPVGFTRFRLTGGEPLLRADLVDIVADIVALPETEDISLTSNGFLLAKLAQPLWEAGLRRLNISLDSLDADTFATIIGRPGATRWNQVWAGIQAAHRVGFDPLKLNVVVIPGVNDHEVLDLAALTLDRQWHVRFIEFMPIGNGDLFAATGWVPSEVLRSQIRDRWGLVSGNVLGNGPADIFQIPGAQGTLGFISQMSECFCDRCNRMRLSADGWLRPCLLNETGQINLRELLRGGMPLAEIRDRVAALVWAKPEINFKMRDSGTTGTYRRTMSQIGG